MAGRSRKKGKKRSRGVILLCVFVEMLILFLFAMVIFWNQGLGEWMLSFSKPMVQELDLSGIESKKAILMRSNGRILGEFGEEEQIYPASLTKMMTAILAIEKLDNLEQEITLTEEMVEGLAEQDATQAGFLPGENVRAIDLLYGALLPSGAECCRALAEAVSGSQEAFVEEMNAKAKRLEMKNTQFQNCTGLHDPEHYSTVEDLALLMKYGIKDATFRTIITSLYHSTPATNMHPDGITFYSSLFQDLSDPTVTGGRILGGRTGYTREAGQCLASFAEIEGREYILVTAEAIGSTEIPIHVQDAQSIYNRLGAATQALQQGM